MLPSERRKVVLECLREAEGPLTSRQILERCDIDQERCKSSAAIMYVRRTLMKLEEDGLVIYWEEPVIHTKWWKLARLLSESVRGRSVGDFDHDEIISFD